MIAVDTNVLVRHLTRDDPVQAEKARALLAGGGILIRKTVILETEWVLRHTYRYSNQQISGAMAGLLDSYGIDVEDVDDVATAIEATRQGLDFADALHLAGCSAKRFATFDMNLQRRASRAFAVPEVITP